MNFNGETRVLRDVVQIIFFLTFRQAFQLQIRNCRWLKLLKLLKLYKSLGVLENLQLKATALLSVFTFMSLLQEILDLTCSIRQSTTFSLLFPVSFLGFFFL